MTTETLRQVHVMHWFVDHVRLNARHRMLRMMEQHAQWAEEARNAPTVASWAEGLARAERPVLAEVSRR
jgi:hypothetical protein